MDGDSVMLQMGQLEHVSALYAEQVGVLRRFLAGSGLQVNNPDSLAHLVERLRSDRPLRRDLLLHLASLIHSSPQPLSHADLLATVTIAAAGPFATAAEDADAQELLHFLMDAQARLVATRDIGSGSVTNQQNEDVRDTAGTSPLDVPSTRADAGTTQSKRAVIAALLTIAACLLAIVLFTTLRAHRQLSDTASSSNTPGPGPVQTHRADSAALLTGRSPSVASPLPPTQRARTAAAEPVPVLAARRNPLSPSPLTPSPATSSKAAAMAAQPPGAATDTRAVAAAPTDSPAPPNAGAAPGRRMLGAVPSSLLSQRLGARPLPADEPDYSSASRPGYPRLLRRHALAPLAEPVQEDSDLLAANHPPALFQTGRTATGKAFASTVQPISLGIMAANILYSPAPAYPPAAAAAHVQGEVRVQAEVDRDGNVASARVISGPPLLRDAAVDAVQRWRYRPWMSAGKPVAMSATAVVDFQLQ